jgi:hypothetical protein
MDLPEAIRVRNRRQQKGLFSVSRNLALGGEGILKKYYPGLPIFLPYYTQ